MTEPPAIEHPDLRSAIEFAVLVAEEANRGRRSLPFPKELKSQFGVARIPSGALGRLRRAIEGDDVFRERIAVGAVPELVDPVGMLWLQRPAGWDEKVAELIAERAATARDADLRATLKRSEKRRSAAEQVAIRSQATIVEQQSTIDALRSDLDAVRADLAKADDTIAELRHELVDVRNEARHARDREAATKARLDAFAAQRPSAPDPGAEPTPDLPATAPPPAVDTVELDSIARVARELGDRIDALAASLAPPAGAVDAAPPPARRRPVRLPGGVIATSRTAAEFLMRSDAVVLVDGYNVAKLQWPEARLDDQRRRLLDALENVARRLGADVTVVFDGSQVIGAHADRRRMVRVVYSSEGVSADDVIRDEVRRLPTSRAVVVVTNDAEIVHDVKALGANVIPSNALLAAI